MTTRGRSLGRVLTFAVFAVLMLAVSGCTVIGGGPQSVNEPAGDNMRRIWDLFVPIFWMSVVVFVIVQGILIYAVVRFRRRPDSPMPHAMHGNTKLEIAWTIAPALILAVIAVPTLTTIADFARDPGEEALTVEVIGHQWWWEFRYPDQDIVTAGDLVIPVDRPIRFQLHSADVIHSFWVPRLAGKTDVVPGHVRTMHFTAQEIGGFRGQCAEFCGIQHAQMAFWVDVKSADDFDAWVAEHQEPTLAASDDQLVQQGQEIFLGAGGCLGCHTITGTDAAGLVGPNLTLFGDRHYIGAGVLENTPENLATWIEDPQAVKKGNLMPDTGLNADQIQAVVAFLESMKSESASQ